MKQGKWALPALFAGALGIAFAPIFVRWSEVGPVATAFWRMALALPLLALWASLQPRRAAAPARHTGIAMALLAGLFFAADLAVWHWSIRLTSVANATFLANLAPVAVTLGAWVLLKERAKPVFFVGMALALTGAALLVQANVGGTGDALLGDALGILTAFFYAGYQLCVKRLRGAQPTARIMLVSGAACAAVLLPLALASGETVLPTTATGWLVVLALAVVCQFGGQSLITYAVAHLPASFASVSLLVQPVAAAALAWLLFGETLAALQWLGAAAVLAGIWLARRGTHA
ncbi:MAG: DMT family transporter [Rhodocyclaceae bacterium]|jgi:drug/metabolite transporter (DMT)-like permease|nr:DMT family transporter [Rhodocyclaceae bacterium]